tara:strand:+ start:838 stop:1230 length:393 start_codon:yes stop_codon:yes gene_type:complete
MEGQIRIYVINGPHEGDKVPPLKDEDQLAKFMRLPLKRKPVTGLLSELVDLNAQYHNGKKLFNPVDAMEIRHRHDEEMRRQERCTHAAYELVSYDEIDQVARYRFMKECEVDWNPGMFDADEGYEDDFNF